MNGSENIVEIFKRQCENTLSEKGVPNQCVWESGEAICVGLLCIDPQDVLKFVMNCLFFQGAKELVFGLDRYVHDEDEDTDSVLTVFHFNPRSGWHYGVIEYQWEPRVWKDIDWHNEYWSERMEEEIIKFFELSFMKLEGEQDES